MEQNLTWQKIFLIAIIPINMLNLFGWLTAVIWLLIAGRWKSLFLSVPTLLLGFLILIPIFFLPSLSFFEKKENRKVTIILSSISLFYTIFLITVWCLWVLHLFTKNDSGHILIPLSLLSYSVAMAPWVDRMQKDSLKNEFEFISILSAQFAYLISIILLNIGLSYLAITITFAIIMSVSCIGELIYAFYEDIVKYKLGRKSKKSERFFQTLEKIGEDFPGQAFKMVETQIKESINSNYKSYINIMEKSDSTEKLAYAMVSNISGDMVESGEFHIYRGVLSPSGSQLLSLFDNITDQQVSFGFIDKDFAKKQKLAIRENIKYVG